MNRIYSVFLVVAASCSCAFAASTNFIGNGSETIGFTNLQFSGSGDAPTNYAANVENVAALNITGSTFDGGAGGDITVSGTPISKNGGIGLRLTDVGLAIIVDSEFRGGMGANIVLNNGLVNKFPAEAKGGHGIELTGDSNLDLGDGVVGIGGVGGSIINDNGGGKSFGGDGVNRFAADSDASVANITISGGRYQGGKGGSAVYNSDSGDPNDFDPAFFENHEGARGGNGLRVSSEYNWYNSIQSGTVVINDGLFEGGDGGTAQNSGIGPVIASGGHGILVDYTDVFIYGGDFSGGAGGSENGSKGADGYGVRTRDSNLTITKGTFANQGLWFESRYIDNTATISGGTFGQAVFTATDDDFVPSHTTKNTINISGGSFESVLLNGEELNDATITGGTIANLMIEGSGINNLSFAAPATISSIVQNSGTANVNQWADQHFMDTTIAGGTMNFNNQTFNLEDGSSFALLSSDSAVDFGGGLVAKSNSLITIIATGTDSTEITGGNLTFEEGAGVVVKGDGNVVVDDEILIATGTTVDSQMTLSDVVYEGGVWVGGFNELVNNGTQLSAIFGFSRLEQALDLEEGTDFYNAMSDLSDFIGTNGWYESGYQDLKNMSQEEATATLADGYVRAPEMANTLIQLQGLFADQIKDRTRSHLRQQNWGGTTASAPQGAQGPGWDSSMDWLNDHLPKWDAREAVKKDNPPKTGKVHSPKAPREKITLPATYQVWGRAYGSTLEQDATTGFAGYKANIGGGVLGLDKRFNNMLLGLGGGYAHTTVDGNWGSDGEADTVYGTLYAAVAGEKTFMDLNVNYAFNDVETESSQIMQYSGDYKASTASFYLGGGLGLDWGSVLFTPEVSLLTTYYDRESYTETSSAVGPYPDKEWDAYSEWSYLCSLGATFSMVRHIESLNLEMEFRPEVRVHWLHEFNAEMDNPTYLQVGGVNSIGVSLQAREEDLIKVGTGIRFSKWDSDTLEFGLDIDGAFGQDYAAYIISGKLLHRF